jgi:ABC-type branched-subunit amino acid transport system ATPase component
MWSLQVAQYGYVLENGKIALEGSYEKLCENDHICKLYLGG